VAAVSEDLFRALSPVVGDCGLELVDVETGPGLVRVTVDRPGGGADLEMLAGANRAVSRALDDLDPMPGRYTLEVTSPGLERRLRTPEHFARAVGEVVSVRTTPGGASTRRVQGQLTAADPDGFTIEGADVPGGTLRLGYDAVERARTVFEWGPGTGGARPPRGGGRPQRAGGTSKSKKSTAKGKSSPTTERVTTP
jgi:ribosome maturation factor RimP